MTEGESVGMVECSSAQKAGDAQDHLAVGDTTMMVNMRIEIDRF